MSLLKVRKEEFVERKERKSLFMKGLGDEGRKKQEGNQFREESSLKKEGIREK